MKYFPRFADRTCRLVAVLAFVLISGCSTQYTVSEMTETEKYGSAENQQPAVDGVPFRIKERYEVALYQYDPTTKRYKKYVDEYSGVKTGSEEPNPMITMANPERLFKLQFTGSALADASPKFKLRKDGTLELVDTGEVTDHSLEALSKLTTEINEYETVRKESKPAKATADAQTAYLEALHEAENAFIAYEELSPDATDTERLEKRQAMEKAKLSVNLKAEVAKLPVPYPGFSL